MADNAGNESSGRRRQWFARRQVYLRTGQDSQYVELSPFLQIGVALGFGALALWLVGASYGAVSNYLGDGNKAALEARLSESERLLSETQQERDAALEDASRLAGLRAELAEANAALAERPANDVTDETPALQAELEETKRQLDDLRLELSESKSDQAALQARFEAEALATSDESAKTAEEAASLHAQLEEAFVEIEALGQARDEAAAKLAALTEESIAKDETTERNTALLKAATAEIERLQGVINLAETQSSERADDYETAIGKLEQQLGEAVIARDSLEGDVADLKTELDQALATNAETLTAKAEAKATVDATIQAESIAAGLREADLLATIDDLRFELASDAGSDDGIDEEEVVSLRQRVTIAEAEIERLILSGLKAPEEPVAEPAPVEATGQVENANRLRTELLAARADIIKLRADVKAANQRLAEQAEADNGATSRPDNSAKLEQQLASTRSRVQQLNKALADAKLREVAIDLALINVVPSPSPPAPR
ncbi:MAG: hypothetical protein AAGA21_20930 [Pseudomonadota bacterium]